MIEFAAKKRWILASINYLEAARNLVNELEDKKAEDIILLDLREIAIFTDFFIICSGTSDRMIRSLERTAIETMSSQYGLKGRVEGNPSNGWIAIDFNDIVMHIFSPAQRGYYKLEQLWADSKILLRVK